MKRSGKIAAWMLLVALLWSAIPASACSLLLARAPGLPACCRHMAANCSMQGMPMSDAMGPCCQMHGDSAIVPPKASFLSEHPQASLLLHATNMESPRDSTNLRMGIRAQAPPGRSPGGGFILRI